MNYLTRTAVKKQHKDVMLNLYVNISDIVKQAPLRAQRGPGGRPSDLSNDEVVTMATYAIGIAGTKTVKGIYNLMVNSHHRDFPHVPSYQAFSEQLLAAIPLLGWVLNRLMIPDSEEQPNERLRYLDGTNAQVCQNRRGKTHKTARGLATWGQTGQGNFFGFMFHLAINATGELRAVIITPGNIRDIEKAEELLQGFQGAAVADAGYISNPLRRKLWNRGVWFLTGVRKNMKRLMADWQYALLRTRQRIEGVIDYLKEHLNLVSSFPRSPEGFILHYLLVLVTYQFHMKGLF